MKRAILLFSLSIISIISFAQDVIVKKDGSTIVSKVLEIGLSEVKYKKWSNKEGPTYTISKSDILAINYENGEKESFLPSLTPQTNKTEISSSALTSQNSYPDIDLSNYHGYLLEQGNCVFIPTNSTIDYELAGQKEFKKLVSETGYWKVVNTPEQAHFVLQYWLSLTRHDTGMLYVRTRNSYKNQPKCSIGAFSLKPREPETYFIGYAFSGETVNENIKAANEIFNGYNWKLPMSCLTDKDIKKFKEYKLILP